MSKKIDRAAHGPSWTEVTLGALLSALLGVVIGAALLAVRPVVTAKAEPKERAANTVYFIEGSKDPAKARGALTKRKALVDGQSVSVTEDELNALLAPAPAAPPAKADPKAKADAEKAAPAPASNGYFTVGTPNVRLNDGTLQLGAPVTVDLLGIQLVAQASGGFVKRGDQFVYEPTSLYLGSCPVHRLPVLPGLLRNAIFAAQPIPDDIKGAWPKLANVTIEGKVLKLAMP